MLNFFSIKKITKKITKKRTGYEERTCFHCFEFVGVHYI